MTTKKVAFVLVPGAFSPPSFYDKITSLLEAKGYTALPTKLQSAVPRGSRPPATRQDDIDHIQATITNLLDQGKDVVLAMNSFGGFPGSEAAKGLSRAERGEGNGGALIGLVYLASFLPPVGSTLPVLYGMLPGVPGKENDGYRDMIGEEDSAEDGAAWVFNDLPAEERSEHYSKFVNHSEVALLPPLAYAGYKSIPSTYVVCELDKVIPPAKQYESIDIANKDGANIKTVVLRSGHCPMVSHPKEVVDILLDAARVGL